MANRTTALIIDDEPDIRDLLTLTLEQMGLVVTAAQNLDEAHNLLTHNNYDLCLTDMRLPDGDGLTLVDYIQEHHPQTPVAVITAHGNVDIAVEALKKGAFDFISKPLELNRLRSMVQNAAELNSSDQAQSSEQEAAPATAKITFTGSSSQITKLQKQIKKVSRSQAPIFISGESGSGKELVARAIHYSGPRGKAPFIPVNCGAIPAELMESEFFGHKKGSFTGAIQDKQGLFQAANGGTLFLDEVADLPLAMQVKLLRAIQEKTVRPIGEEEEIPVDVRILSATHKNLEEEIRQSHFRQDLYYRINVIEIKVPPLRERTEDVETLANMFLKRFAEEAECSVPRLAPEALESLQRYSFPGNVRELENILERAFTLCDDDVIDLTDIELPENAAGTQNSASASNSTLEFDSIDEHLADIEKDILVKALEETRWNRTAAAKKLGISFRQLRYKLKKLEID